MKLGYYRLAFLCMLCVSGPVAAMPDYGPSGLDGLDQGQLRQLEQGRIVFTVSGQMEEMAEYVEAALLLDKPPLEVWNLLYRTEDHDLYLKETTSSRVISKSPNRDVIEYQVRILMVRASFRLVHTFNWQDLYMHWDLDPGFANGLKEFKGFWRLYDYEGGRTLARYGNRISPAGIPQFVVNLLRRGGVTSALESVRLYAESGGSYRK